MFLFAGMNKMVQKDLISYLKGIIILTNDFIILIIIIFIFAIMNYCHSVLINTNYHYLYLN
jgi:hypothetical protein